MTDRALLAKKLAFIETCIREVRTLSRPEKIKEDIREERFIAHTLQIAIQAAVDVASHVVSDERLGEPRTNRELFDILARHNWLPETLGKKLSNMTGFRNILVHGYETVNLDIVRDVVDNHLDDLLDFSSQVRSRLQEEES